MDAKPSTDSEGTQTHPDKRLPCRRSKTNKSPDSERGKNEDYIQVRHGPHFSALAEAEHPQPASADWKNHAQSGHFRRKTRLRRLLLRRGHRSEDVRIWLPRNEMPKQPEPEA